MVPASNRRKTISTILKDHDFLSLVEKVLLNRAGLLKAEGVSSSSTKRTQAIQSRGRTLLIKTHSLQRLTLIS